jgi:CBS domain-containing protein
VSLQPSYPRASYVLPAIPARDVLSQKPTQLWTVAPDATVYTAIELMASAHVGALLVLDGHQLVGIVSERDYARKVILMGRSSSSTKVADIMTKEVIFVDPETSMQRCMQLMIEHRFRHLPVVASGQVVGIVSIGDLVREMLQQQSQAIEELHRYVSGEPRLTTPSVD